MPEYLTTNAVRVIKKGSQAGLVIQYRVCVVCCERFNVETLAQYEVRVSTVDRTTGEVVKPPPERYTGKQLKLDVDPFQDIGGIGGAWIPPSGEKAVGMRALFRVLKFWRVSHHGETKTALHVHHYKGDHPTDEDNVTTREGSVLHYVTRKAVDDIYSKLPGVRTEKTKVDDSRGEVTRYIYVPQHMAETWCFVVITGLDARRNHTVSVRSWSRLGDYDHGMLLGDWCREMWTGTARTLTE